MREALSSSSYPKSGSLTSANSVSASWHYLQTPTPICDDNNVDTFLGAAKQTRRELIHMIKVIILIVAVAIFSVSAWLISEGKKSGDIVKYYEGEHNYETYTK